MLYKQFKQHNSYSFVTDVIVNASIQKVNGCLDIKDIFMEITPELYDLKELKVVTDRKIILYGKNKFPKPLFYDREMIMHVTAMSDYTNKGILSSSKSINAGESFFGYVVPDEDYYLPRLQMNFCYHYYQYLGPDKTRHITI